MPNFMLESLHKNTFNANWSGSLRKTIRKAYEDSTDVFDLLDDAESSLYTRLWKPTSGKNYDKMRHPSYRCGHQTDRGCTRTKNRGYRCRKRIYGTGSDHFWLAKFRPDYHCRQPVPAMGKNSFRFLSRAECSRWFCQTYCRILSSKCLRFSS